MGAAQSTILRGPTHAHHSPRRALLQHRTRQAQTKNRLSQYFEIILEFLQPSISLNFFWMFSSSILIEDISNLKHLYNTPYISVGHKIPRIGIARMHANVKGVFSTRPLLLSALCKQSLNFTVSIHGMHFFYVHLQHLGTLS